MTSEDLGPLSGLRVLDFTRVLAGPYATMLLADLGADVVKIEHHDSGDDTRAWGPHWKDGLSSYYESVNRNKTSFSCDLKSEQDFDAVRQLCNGADVVMENFRSGTMASLGLGAEALRESNPGLVYCSLTGFGSTLGADLGGYDSIVQALSGLMSVTGGPDGDPSKVGVAVVDIIAGLHLVAGVLAAIRHRDISGVGQHVEVNLMSSALSAMTYHATAVANGGEVPKQLGNRHPSIAPSDVIACVDGSIMLAVGNDRQFRELCSALALPELAADPRFLNNIDRLQNADDLRDLLASALSLQQVEPLVAALERAGVPCAPINGMDSAIAYAARLGLDPVVTMTRPAGAPSHQIRNPIGFSLTPPTYRQAPQHWPDVPRVTQWKETKASWLS